MLVIGPAKPSHATHAAAGAYCQGHTGRWNKIPKSKRPLGIIRRCWDNIGRDWLLKSVPLDVAVQRKCLHAEFQDKNVRLPIEAGAPQDGVASPVSANLALDGLEDVACSPKGMWRPRNFNSSGRHVLRRGNAKRPDQYGFDARASISGIRG